MVNRDKDCHKRVTQDDIANTIGGVVVDQGKEDLLTLISNKKSTKIWNISKNDQLRNHVKRYIETI